MAVLTHYQWLWRTLKDAARLRIASSSVLPIVWLYSLTINGFVAGVEHSELVKCAQASFGRIPEGMKTSDEPSQYVGGQWGEGEGRGGEGNRTEPSFRAPHVVGLLCDTNSICV